MINIFILVIILLAILIPISYTLGITRGEAKSTERLTPNPSITSIKPLTASGCSPCEEYKLCNWNSGVRTDIMRVFC